MTFSRTAQPLLAVAALVFIAGETRAQGKPADPKHEKQDAAAPQRVGDPYPFDTCPVTGKKLGAMGDPVVSVYDGREVRFCCPACPKKFEQDKAANLAKLDAKVIEDQRALYPLKTSVVSGKNLGEKPLEFVYGNRLVRVVDDAERAAFVKDASSLMATLDKAVIAQQGKDYALKTCPVSGDKFGGDMGEPKDLVIAGRLIRMCCDDCRKDVEKNPAKYLAIVDHAREGHDEKHDGHHDEDQKKKHGDHDHGGN